MTSPKDFEEVIRKRIEQLNKQNKSTIRVRDPKKPSEPSNKPSSSDEGVDKDKAVKRAKKAKQKRLNGYKNRVRK
tara:strand:- start:241 stop:465 length:225 start_codon:yes stop_codon:yes gene_type:complete